MLDAVVGCVVSDVSSELHLEIYITGNVYWLVEREVDNDDEDGGGECFGFNLQAA